ncbi:hypothetical protein [Nitrosopumilus ureiphilus]|uniref:Uncharacterized protein n=1 Tax=Nitrosopumilus ureiphilus TaxID=1470067 RepID=A0A7D5R3X4_9ARCH|nr:hypothetical protein [Nitrosopumilus ureiphilus]QLH07420.1 hypothetical protein C5F50_10335 [Nitrosopumilus ureiphilus]
MPDTCKLCTWGTIPIVVGYFVIYLITRFIEKQPFEQYLEYQDSILAGVGIIFGVLGVVTFYYIGKYHDHSKEIIKARSEHSENFKKMILLSEIKKINISEELKRDIEHEKGFEPDYNEQKDIAKEVHNKILKQGIIIGGFLTWILIGFFTSSYDPTLNNFINIIAGLATGIILFVVGWILYDHLLERLTDILDLDYQVNVNIKIIIYKLEKTLEGHYD